MSDSVSTPVAHSIRYEQPPLRTRAGRVATSMLLAALFGMTMGSCLSMCFIGR